MPKAVFLDRDGVINQCAAPHHYIAEWKDFIFLPGVEQALKKLRDAGFQLIMISNQRGIARGMFTFDQVNELHGHMQSYLRSVNAQLDGIYICPHNEGECNCRKPNIGLFLQAEQDFRIDKRHSWMVGDTATDIEAGRRYGVRTIFTTSLSDAAKQILDCDMADKL